MPTISPICLGIAWLTGITLASVKIHPFGLSFLTNSGGNETWVAATFRLIWLDMTGKKDGNITWEDDKKNTRPFSRCPPSCKAPSGNSGFAESQTTASWGAPSVSAKSKTCGEVQHWTTTLIDRMRGIIVDPNLSKTFRHFKLWTNELGKCAAMFGHVFCLQPSSKEKKTAIFLSLKSAQPRCHWCSSFRAGTQLNHRHLSTWVDFPEVPEGLH